MDTKFKQKIIMDLKKKNLADSSIKLYLGNLERLNDELPLNNLNFLSDSDKILDKISTLKPTTQRGYLISICSVLEIYKDTSKKMLNLYQNYYNLMIKSNDKIKAIPTDKLSETQEKNWSSWQDVLNKFDELKKDVEPFINNETINKKNYNKLLEYVVLALYTYNEPRRNEYVNMLVVKKYNPSMNSDNNYLSYDDKKLIFNKYKTSKKAGQEIFDIHDNLFNVINQYFKFHPLIKGKKLSSKTSFEFLVNYDGSNLPLQNGLTRILNKIFDKNLSSSLLRHIYLSYKYGPIVKDMEKTAKAMSHSLATQKAYIKDSSPVKII